jgi:hypothetical protein
LSMGCTTASRSGCCSSSHRSTAACMRSQLSAVVRRSLAIRADGEMEWLCVAWCPHRASVRDRVRVAVPGRTAGGRRGAADARARRGRRPRCAPSRPRRSRTLDAKGSLRAPSRTHTICTPLRS